MIRYLLDSNAVSDLVRDPVGKIAMRVTLLDDDDVAISIIVAAEIQYGAEKRGSRSLSRRVEVVLGALSVVPFRQPAEREYGKLRTRLERRGTPIGHHDMLIAAHALALDCILVTDNAGEFRRVPGLRVENWLREV